MRSGNAASNFVQCVASGLRRVRKCVPADHIAIGVLVVLFAFFGFRINVGMGWLAFGLGLLLLTWHTPMRAGLRALIYLMALCPILFWFDRIARFLFHPVHSSAGDVSSTPELLFRYGFAAAAVLGLLIVVRHRAQAGVGTSAGQQRGTSQREQSQWSHIPKTTFRDLGGMHEEKRRIARIVENRLHPERTAEHGI
ncbi:MAG: hypothetical protein JOZ62_20125, partial [Acidobacteriaceae bacterium]|nr:hypothetical protein [Acidobacteriaceae bacterium]